MKRFLFLFAGSLLLGSCNQNNPSTETVVAASPNMPSAMAKTINSQQAKALLSQQPTTIVLDVRTEQEFTGGHLAQALNLDFNAPDFQTQLLSLDKTKPYLVYCAVGGRSSKAAKFMQEMGFQQVYNVSEGFPALQTAGLSTAR
jgi:phage shock protein E